MLKNKCQGCAERKVGCHATCERYKEFQVANEEYKKKVRMENGNSYVTTSWNYYHKEKRNG